MKRRARSLMPMLIAVCAGVGAGSSFAQSYSAHGAVGYLQEWEMKGSLARTVIGAGADYSGPVTLRHVGLCSSNGVEEKSGTLALKIRNGTSDIEGTLALPDDNCRLKASASRDYAGLLNCRDGQGIPIKFSIEQVQDPARGPLAAMAPSGH